MNPVKLLFLCTHNACRSILAEAIARKLGGDRIQVRSAGSHPAGRVHPLTLQYLSEAGYPLQGLASQSLDDIADFCPDIVITVCDNAAQEPCPLWLGAAVKVHWGFPDPSRVAGSDVDRAGAYTSLMGEMEHRISALLSHSFADLSANELGNLLNTIATEN